MSVRKIIVARRPGRDRSCALLVLLAAGGAPALADPADYVFTPYTDIGKWQVAYGLGTEHDRDGARETQQALSLGGTPSAAGTRPSTRPGPRTTAAGSRPTSGHGSTTSR